MPIFEYECRDCGAKFEKFIASSAEKVACRNCSSSQVAQLLSVFAVSGNTTERLSAESGPCPCGAPRRGMCRE
jgi:putative FmdB family regulatory protein